MRKLVAKVAALTLAVAGTLATAGPAAAHGNRSGHERQGTTVLVHSDGATVTLSRSRVDEGRIAFTVDTSNTEGGSQITLFRLVGDATLATIIADLGDAFSQDLSTRAKSTQNLTRHARFFGLADVVPGTPAVVTETLPGGAYFLVDVAAALGKTAPAFTPFTVRDSDEDGDDSGRGLSEDRRGERRHGPVVKMTSADTFVSPSTLPARGTVTVRNVSDTLHFMTMGPVKKGTTDAQVQAYFDSGNQGQLPFMADGPTLGLGILSPGRQAELTYNLSPGTYLMLCFIADDKTGMDHAVMGMHKVVTLK